MCRSPCFCPFLKSLVVPPPSTLSFLCCTMSTRIRPLITVLILYKTNVNSQLQMAIKTKQSVKVFFHFLWHTCILYLKYDLSFQLCRWGKLFSYQIHRFSQQFVSKYFPENPSHLTLLLYRTMLLDGQDHWEPEREAVLLVLLKSTNIDGWGFKFTEILNWEEYDDSIHTN